MRDFELLTLILSANVWQRYNGTAMLIADKPATEYFDKRDLLDVFKGGYKELIVSDNIDTNMFWAGGKLYALKELDRPICMVDLDLIVWKNMEDFLDNKNILVIHREEITENIYPDFHKFKTVDGYAFPDDYDMSVLPCNTAMMYADDIAFVHEYADAAIEFMTHAKACNDNLNRMVFAEQRLLSIMAKRNNKEIKAIFPLARDIGVQNIFTHLWGHKNILKFNQDERVKFCKKVINRLRYEYPDSYEKVSKLEEIKEYL